MRQNIIEDVSADIFGVAQSTISRCITFLTPFAEKATEEDRPTEEDAAEATRGAIALVDGTLWPCWSWDGESELWAGKYKTTGHGSLIVTNLQGRITFVSEPVTGNQHDMRKLKGSAVEKILKNAGGVFGDKGFIGTDYITTPIRKPEYRELLQWEHEWNNQVSSYPCASRAGRRHLEDVADSLHRLSSASEDLQVVIPRSNRTLLFQGEFCITLLVSASCTMTRSWPREFPSCRSVASARESTPAPIVSHAASPWNSCIVIQLDLAFLPHHEVRTPDGVGSNSARKRSEGARNQPTGEPTSDQGWRPFSRRGARDAAP